MVRADRVRSMFGDGVPAMLRSLIQPDGARSEVIPVTVGAAFGRIATSLFESPLYGPLRQVFVEGAVLQLLAMKTARAALMAEPVGLTALERVRLGEARERLLTDMRDPPGAGELAVMTEMSETALNAGFRTLFGGTVYEVLRDERLEHARIAIETTDSPVKQIAHAVGYNHVTNFISAFTRRYGRPPRRYIRELRTTRGADDAAEPRVSRCTRNDVSMDESSARLNITRQSRPLQVDQPLELDDDVPYLFF